MLIALSLDASLALFNLRGQPGHIEVVQGLQPRLHVDAGAHRLRGADQDADAAGVEVVEQALLLGGALEVLHEGDFGGWDAIPNQFLLDPAVGGEAALGFDADGPEVAEDHLAGARDRVGRTVRTIEPGGCSLAPDAMHVAHQLVELVLRLVIVLRPDQPHVDGGVATVGDDGEKDVVALLHPSGAAFDLADPVREDGLVVPEGSAGVSGDQLARSASDAWQPEVAAQVILQHDVRAGPEHIDEFGDVDELAEPLDRLVGARGLQLQFGPGVAEGRGPGVEFVDTALLERVFVLEPQEGEHLPERVGDRCARGLDQRTARIAFADEPGFDIQVPGTLRAVRVDTFQVDAVGCERELPEFLGFVDDHLVDADLLDRHHVVAAVLDRLQPLGQFLLHRLEALARGAIIPVRAKLQCLVCLDLPADHRLLVIGRDGDEPEGGMGDEDCVPVRRCRPGKEACPLVLAEVGLVGDQDAGGRVELEELPRGLRETMAGHDQHGFGDQAEPLLLHDGGGNREGFSGADGVGDIGVAGADDPPDHALLVRVEADDVAGAGQRQVRAIEVPRHEIVETIVVDARQAVGAVRVGPDPLGEAGLDFD